MAWLVEGVYPVFLKDIHVTLMLLRSLLLTTGSVPVSRPKAKNSYESRFSVHSIQKDSLGFSQANHCQFTSLEEVRALNILCFTVKKYEVIFFFKM